MTCFDVIVITCGSLAALLAYGWAANRRRLRERRARFADRPSLPVGEIYAQHYAGCGFDLSCFESEWCYVAELLNLDPTRLRPTDRFDVELAVPNVTFDHVNELEDMLSHVMNVSRQTHRPLPDQSFSDLGSVVRWLCESRTHSVQSTESSG